MLYKSNKFKSLAAGRRLYESGAESSSHLTCQQCKRAFLFRLCHLCTGLAASDLKVHRGEGQGGVAPGRTKKVGVGVGTQLPICRIDAGQWTQGILAVVRPWAIVCMVVPMRCQPTLSSCELQEKGGRDQLWGPHQLLNGDWSFGQLPLVLSPKCQHCSLLWSLILVPPRSKEHPLSAPSDFPGHSASPTFMGTFDLLALAFLWANSQG
jgi:hypothetical protein